MKVTSAIQVTIWDTFTMLKKILGFEVFDSEVKCLQLFSTLVEPPGNVVRSFDHLILLLTKRNSWTVKYGKMKSKFYEFWVFLLRFSAKKKQFNSSQLPYMEKYLYSK